MRETECVNTPARIYRGAGLGNDPAFPAFGAAPLPQHLENQIGW